MARTGSHRTPAAGRLVEDKEDKRRLVAFEDKRASDIEGSVAPLSRVHFVDTRLIPKEEWQQSVCMPLPPNQQCMTNHMKRECCLSKSKIGEITR